MLSDRQSWVPKLGLIVSLYFFQFVFASILADVLAAATTEVHHHYIHPLNRLEARPETTVKTPSSMCTSPGDSVVLLAQTIVGISTISSRVSDVKLNVKTRQDI